MCMESSKNCYHIVETMPQFMSQNLLSEADPQFVNQSAQGSPDFNYQKNTLPTPPPGVAKPQNLLSPPGIFQTLSSYQWDTPPASKVITGIVNISKRSESIISMFICKIKTKNFI